MANPAITVEFLTDTAKLTKGLNQAEGGAKSASSRIGGLGKAGALAAGAAGVGALVATLKIGIGEFAQAQKVGAQTNAVLKSTGGAAKVTAGHVEDLAGSLMKKSGVDDEAIQSGENLLLTFTGIRNEVGKGNDIFDQATKAALDMSVAMGTDMTSASMTLGKALNDPVSGMTKLTKQGVTFTDAQKAQVKAMQEAGDTAGAQKLILAELNKEFGGSAEAAGKTLPGQLAIARESFNNFAGMLVEKAIPYLQLAIGWLKDHWPEIQARLQAAWAAIEPVLVQLGTLVGTVAKLIIDNWGTIGPVVEAVFNIIKTVLEQVGNIISLFVAILSGDWSKAWQEVQDIVKTALKLILQYITAYGAVAGLLWKAAKAVGGAILDAIVKGLEALPGALWTLLQKVPALWLEMYLTIFGWGLDLAGWILGAIVKGLRTVASEVWDQIKKIPARFGEMVENIKGWGADVGKWILQGVWDGMKATKDWLEEKITGLFHDAIDWVKDALGISSPSTVFAEIGKDMIRGMVGGIGSMGGFLKDAVVKLAKEAPGKLLGKLGGLFGGGATKQASVLDTLLAFAQEMGATVSSTTSGKHAAGSFHYQGRAVDVVGTAEQLRRFFIAAIRLFGTRIKELFYDPMGFYVDNGRLIRGAIGGHGSHAHLALAAGGIVTQPTRALIGEAGPEAVIPLGRSGGGIQVRVFIGETELKGMVKTEVVTENNRLAQTLLAGAV